MLSRIHSILCNECFFYLACKKNTSYLHFGFAYLFGCVPVTWSKGFESVLNRQKTISASSVTLMTFTDPESKRLCA